MSSKFKRIVFTLVYLGTLCFSNFANAHDSEISISIKRENSVYNISTIFQSEASPEKAWSVLTDYEQLPSLFHQIVASKVIRKDGKKMWLYQEGQETIFFFINLRFKVLLEITELPFGNISFHDTSNHDFSVFAGEWHILKKGKITEIRYFLKAKPKFDPIEFITKSIMKRSTEAMLLSLKNKMDDKS